ncbi:MAG: hypothetical protein BAJATHORv1_10137 [Candidatus Thorarchaeota archaeon]|nr:MAG: hypothetical protein BAJATHORv1_10137 [Candidatus Thorarchaeota archaeon]
MHIREIQEIKQRFEKERRWDEFPASQIFVHLIEELGEISRHISFEEGYKVEGIGHKAPDKSELSREFAQVFFLFLQIVNHFGVDLESSILSELELMKERFPAEEWAKYMDER